MNLKTLMVFLFLSLLPSCAEYDSSTDMEPYVSIELWRYQKNMYKAYNKVWGIGGADTIKNISGFQSFFSCPLNDYADSVALVFQDTSGLMDTAVIAYSLQAKSNGGGIIQKLRYANLKWVSGRLQLDSSFMRAEYFGRNISYLVLRRK